MTDSLFQYLDAPIDRRGTFCVKWDGVDERFNGSNLLPAWIADMDFPTVPEVCAALTERAAHPIFGYTHTKERDAAAECAWLKRRYAFDCKPEWILYSPGVVDSLFFGVQALTQPGDKVLIFTPVYGPFYSCVKNTGRTLVECPLRSMWDMDFDAAEDALRQGVKLIILCAPHNPIGRVWTRDELQTIVDLANRYGATILSDEIHADFTLDDRAHTRILSLKDSEHCVMLTSATKSFNLAGLRQSSIICPDEQIRSALSKQLEIAHATDPNIFGALAQTTAYTHGDAWMDAVKEYIQSNRDALVARVRAEMPRIRVYPQEATYLMWLDCTELGMTHEQAARFLIEKAHIVVNEGTFFGALGENHFRVNVATQRRNVDALLERLSTAVKGL